MAKCIADSSLGTASDTYLYSLAQSGDVFATIGSDDALRLFDSSLKLVSKASPAHNGVTCLASFGNGFATAGRDGAVRCWDARTRRVGVDIIEPQGRGVSSIACHEQLITVGTESNKEGLGDVSVLLFDTRNPSTPLRNYAESHTDTITQLAFHPTQPNVLMSGSTDGLVSIFDMNILEEEDALQQVLNPRAAIHCSGFLSATMVYVLTTDEHFSIYSLGESNGEEDSSVQSLGDVRDKLQCTYVVNLINGPSPVLAYGHNANQTLSIVQLDLSVARSFGPVVDLPAAHGEEIVRDLLIMNPEKKAISCGEDGHVKVWDLSRAKG